MLSRPPAPRPGQPAIPHDPAGHPGRGARTALLLVPASPHVPAQESACQRSGISLSETAGTTDTTERPGCDVSDTPDVNMGSPSALANRGVPGACRRPLGLRCPWRLRASLGSVG